MYMSAGARVQSAVCTRGGSVVLSLARRAPQRARLTDELHCVPLVSHEAVQGLAPPLRGVTARRPKRAAPQLHRLSQVFQCISFVCQCRRTSRCRRNGMRTEAISGIDVKVFSKMAARKADGFAT